jgi:predicted dinucleotide-binding enzyme
MRIAIIGKGNVGAAVGSGWHRAGHDVMYGVRNPIAADERPVRDATSVAEVVVLCVMWHAAEAALRDCGDLTGKILIDPTNPLAMDDAGGLKLAFGFDRSSGEEVARLSGARVVKTLNQVGAQVMADASTYAQRPVQFVASDDEGAKATVRALVEDLGFEVLDAGPLAAARFLEPMAMIWIDQAMRYGMDGRRAWALLESSTPDHRSASGGQAGNALRGR